MTTVFAIIFWCAIAWVLYIFVGYPLLMALLARLRPRPLAPRECELPSICLVMAAYNEEKVIGERLRNYLELDYPRHLLAFKIGSDASSDRTDEIIEGVSAVDDSVQLTRYNRVGKTHIVYELADTVTADIILFTDADILIERRGLHTIARAMSDPSIGGVIGRMTYRDSAANSGNRGQGKYLQLENRLRRWESLFYTTVGPSGECFAVKRAAYRPLADYRLSDDNHLVISVPGAGFRVWYEPTLLVQEINRRSLVTEARRRLRMGQQATATYLAYRATRWPWRSMVGFEIWSHKLLRNLAAIPMALVALCSFGLAWTSPLYAAVAIGAAAWGALMLGGWIGDKLSMNVRLLQYPLYFTSMLSSLAVGSVRAMFSGGMEKWTSPRI